MIGWLLLLVFLMCRWMWEVGMGVFVEGKDFRLVVVICGGCEGIFVVYDIFCIGNGFKVGIGMLIWVFILW